MLIATLTLLAGGASDLDAFVEHSCLQPDLLVFACPPGSASQRDALVRFQARGLPVLIFDLPGDPAGDVSRLAILLSNLERFFRLDALVILDAGELVEDVPRQRLECLAKRLAPLEVAEIQFGVRGSTMGLIERSSGRWCRLVRLGDRPSNVSTWREALEGHGADSGCTSRPVVGDPAPEISRSDGRSSSTTSQPEEGIWNAGLHRSNFYLDVPPFRYVADRYRPDSVLDLGCGLGGYPELFRRWGARGVLGIDGFESGGDLACLPECYRQADLREPLRLGSRFELVISTEVIEHLDERHEQVFLDNIERHAEKLILFSAARPSQPGVGHVNCRPIEHWLSAWRRRGWVPSHFDTCAIRSLSTFFWFRRNLVLLVRSSAVDELSRKFESSPAGEVEIRTAKWFAQEPRVCRHSFSELLPGLYVAEET